MAKKLTNKDIRYRLKKEFNGEYELIGDYTGSTKPITLKHVKCGTIYTIKRAKTFLKENGGLCPTCRNLNRKHNSTKRVTEEEFIERLKEEVGEEYTYLGGYVNTQKHVKLRHNICGTEYKVKPYMVLGKKKRRCPVCGNKNRGKYAIKENYLQTILNEKSYGNEYEWLDDYKNNNKLKHRILHKTCGNTYEVRPNDFQQGYRCPFCSNLTSDEEDNFYNFIKRNYDGKIIRHYRDKLEIDIYLPELKMGFEYNGYYWHNDKCVDKNYHLNKYEYFLSKGIRIFFIDSIDFINKPKIIKSKILHLLKLNNKPHIYARKCNIKYNLVVDKEKIFLDKYHIQGYCSSSFNIYLSYNKKVVALMSFATKRINVNNKKENRIELLRYATTRNFIIVGGFSRLLKHAIDYIKKYYPNISEIYTYADRTLSDGDVYYKNGFCLDHISKPSYYYINKKKKVNRFSMRKSELKKKFPDYYDDSLTEFEIVDKIPYWYRIWNIGNYCFYLKLEKY